VNNGEMVYIPQNAGRIDHEVELAVHIKKGGKMIEQGRGIEHVFGYSVALDITARDIQSAAKKEGLPWSLAKGMDTFCPISEIFEPKNSFDPHGLDISLTVNKEVRQKSNTSLMIFSIPAIIEYISRFMTLERGDIILTGTPEGVSPIVAGDQVVGEIEHVGKIEVVVANLL